MNNQPPILVAHRGLHLRHPENSFAAFAAAWKAGISWCECDLQLSSDGREVIIHDETLDRTTTGSGPIALQKWSDLKKLYLRDSSGKPTRERLPLLNDLLKQLPVGRGIWVETKPPMRERIVPLAKKLCSHGCALHSFHLSDVLRAGPFVNSALLAEKVRGLSAAVRQVHLDQKCFSAVNVKMLRNKGYILGAWTVNSPREIRRMANFGIEWIITDTP